MRWRNFDLNAEDFREVSAKRLRDTFLLCYLETDSEITAHSLQRLDPELDTSLLRSNGIGDPPAIRLANREAKDPNR
jgi:hypothetical protein